MKLLLLCLLFAPIFYLAFKHKKWYLYLPLALISVLPEQFAIELHEKLPLISGSRVLILIMMGFWLWDKWKTKKFFAPKSLIIFFAVNLVVSLVNFRYGMGELNRIFLLIFERVLLAIVIADLIKSREEFDRCVDFMIMGCTVLAVIGIVQTVFEYDISSVLHLQTTMASITLSSRMGLTRAFGTYNAISYGCYCAFMVLPIIYRLSNTKQYWYTIALALTLTALICTFSRSAWLCIAGILVVVLLIYRLKLIRKMLPSLGILVLLCVTLCFFQPKLFNAFVETGKSSINTIIDIIPDSITSIFIPDSGNGTGNSSDDSPESSDKDDLKFELSGEFGMNGEDPTYSRMAQWTAVEYMIRDGNALFGHGYNALPEGRIHFYFDRWGKKWEPTTFLDVGLVALFAEGGFIGALSFLGLLAYIFVCGIRKSQRFSRFDFHQAVIFMIPLFILLNFLASFMFEDAVWLFLSLVYAFKRLETNNAEPVDIPEPDQA